jgi:chemotaxis protein CheD
MRRAAGALAKVYLHAGQLHAANEPTEITTILGSCVAVCLLDPMRRAAGANHYLLPMKVGGPHASLRFGNVAIDALIEKMLALGSFECDLRAKIFGGATLVDGGRAPALGEQNVILARETLAARRIPIVSEDVGGTRGRKMILTTDDGVVLVKRL